MARETGVHVQTDALTGQQQYSYLVAHIYVGSLFCLVLDMPDIHQKTLLQTTQLILGTPLFQVGLKHVWMPGLNPLSRHRHV